MKNTKLYRPVGEKEMILILDLDYKSFPPRLNWQPIFYPVLNEQYASEIASKWNTNDEGGNYLGFVTEFEISEELFRKYNIQNVGLDYHNELWVPSDELAKFNEQIIGKIKVLKVYKGANFVKSDNLNITNLLSKLEIIERG